MRVSLALAVCLIVVAPGARAESPASAAESAAPSAGAPAAESAAVPAAAEQAPAQVEPAPVEPAQVEPAQVEAPKTETVKAGAPKSETAAPTTEVASAEPTKSPPAAAETGKVAAPAAALAAPVAATERPSEFRHEVHGFVRAGWSQVQRDPADFNVGLSSGFRLYNTRIELSGGYGRALRFVLSADTDTVRDSTHPGARLVPALRDAFVEGTLPVGSGRGWLRLGQFKTPFNGELLLGDAETPFARRSVLSEGMSADEGRVPWPALGLDRQLGADVGAELGLGPVKAQLDLAVVNGNGRNQARNDNRVPGFVGRARLSWQALSLAGAAYLKDRTAGPYAALQDERDFAWEVDAQADLPAAPSLRLTGARLFAMYGRLATKYLTTSAPDFLAWGATCFASARFDAGPVQVEPAFRAALYEPTNQILDAAGNSAAGLLDLTPGLNVYPRSLPVRVQLNWTRRIETADSGTYPNDLAEVALQANF